MWLPNASDDGHQSLPTEEAVVVLRLKKQTLFHLSVVLTLLKERERVGENNGLYSSNPRRVGICRRDRIGV